MTFLHLNGLNKKYTTVADIPLLEEIAQEELLPRQYPNTRSTSSHYSWDVTQCEPSNEFGMQINPLVYASESGSEKMFKDILTSLAQSDSAETSEVDEMINPMMCSATLSNSLPHLRDIIPESISMISTYQELVQEELLPRQYPNTRSTSSHNSWDETQCVSSSKFVMQINPLIYASESGSEKMFKEMLTSLAQSESAETSEVDQMEIPMISSATPPRSLPHLRDIILESISIIPTYQHSMEDFEETVPLRLALGQLRDLSQVQKKKTKVGEKRGVALLFTQDVLPYRSGRWSHEETAYAEALLGEFESGLLPLVDGTLLRVFVAAVLNCDPMRVSKKFAGRGAVKAKLSSMGTLFFKRDLETVWMLSEEEIQQKQEHFVELETNFFQKVYELGNKKRTTGSWSWPLFMGWTTYDPQSNTLISYFNKSQSVFDGHKRMSLLVPKPVKRKPVPHLLQQNSIKVLIQHLETAVETLEEFE